MVGSSENQEDSEDIVITSALGRLLVLESGFRGHIPYSEGTAVFANSQESESVTISQLEARVSSSAAYCRLRPDPGPDLAS